MNTETPEEKAKRLGLELLPPIPLQEKTHVKIERELFLQMVTTINNYVSELVAVCGACGKEIKRYDALQKKPCGHTQCPFGILTNNQP